jgi:hypothetical protein
LNLGRLRQRIYSPPPLTTRALPREREKRLQETGASFNLVRAQNEAESVPRKEDRPESSGGDDSGRKEGRHTSDARRFRGPAAHQTRGGLGACQSFSASGRGSRRASL